MMWFWCGTNKDHKSTCRRHCRWNFVCALFLFYSLLIFMLPLFGRLGEFRQRNKKKKKKMNRENSTKPRQCARMQNECLRAYEVVNVARLYVNYAFVKEVLGATRHTTRAKVRFTTMTLYSASLLRIHRHRVRHKCGAAAERDKIAFADIGGASHQKYVCFNGHEGSSRSA